METETGGFGQWRYSHYFQFIARKDKNIRVKCTLCPGSKYWPSGLPGDSQWADVPFGPTSHTFFLFLFFVLTDHKTRTSAAHSFCLIGGAGLIKCVPV